MADIRASGGGARARPRANTQQVRPRGLLHWLQGLALFAFMIVVVAGAAGGMLFVRLQHGPISLKPIADMIEREINSELTGLEARIEDAQLAYEDGGAQLRLSNLSIAEPNGSVVVQVPVAAVELSGRAMQRLRLVPSRIELIEPRLALTYTDAGGLTLSIGAGDRKREGRLGGPPGESAPSSAPPVTPAQPDATPSPPGERLDFGEVIAAVTAAARKRAGSASYLREIGVRDAWISVDNRGALSEWRVLEGSVDLGHSNRESIASGRARVASSRGPWSVSVEAVEKAETQSVTIAAEINDLHPRVLGVAMPQLAMLQPLDLPVSGVVKIALGPKGVLSAVDLTLTGNKGALTLPGVTDAPFTVDGGGLQAGYSSTTRKLELSSARLAWGNSRFSMKGSAVADADGSGWSFAFDSDRGQLAAEEFGIEPVALAGGQLRGRYVTIPGGNEIRIERIAISAGGAELSGSGGIRTPVGASTPHSIAGGFFEAKLGPTSADRLKAIWPRGIANGARTWVGERIKRGSVKSGTIKFYSGSYAREAGAQSPTAEPRRLSLALEAADVTGVPLSWLSPIEAPRLLIRLEDNAIEVNIPDAQLAMSPSKRVPIKGGRFAATDLEKPAPLGEVTFRAATGLVPALEVLDQSPLKLLRANAISTDGIDGKVDGQIKLSFPLIADLLARDVAIEAKAKVTDAKVKQLGGAYDVQGGTAAIDVSAAAVDVKGEFLANGVPVKVAWQRILEDNGEKQPPLRLSASLDNADRDQLGIDINHIVQGEVPVEVLVEKGQGAGDQPSVKMRADLTAAEIGFDSIAWRKARGRTAVLQADLLRGKTYKLELQNLRLAGDDIAMEGWAGIAGDNRLREIELKELSLNVISRLEVQGVLKTDAADKAGVWHVKVKGRTFDGRDLFKSLLSVSNAPEKPGKPGKPSAGMDLDADIDNVLGHNDVAIRGFKMKLTRRGDRLTSIDGRGTLDGGSPIAIVMAPASAGTPRTLLADTPDAGQAFKLIGFYPNMQSGRARLEVNVDGRGPAEKTGILWVEDFRILGDPVVSEVLLTTPAPGEKPRPSRTRNEPQRETFEFNRMKVPFSVGHGQFVLENAYLRGPLQGVALTGKVDFKLKTVNLGGTFVPLQGLNNALGDVPLFGELMPGGMFGLTFAVQGPLAQPQVLVNPLSAVTPGIFRELMQMTNPNPKVVPRDEKAPAAPVEKRVRSTPPTAAEPSRAAEPQRPKVGAQTGGGWTSEVSPSLAPVPPQPQPAKRPAKKPVLATPEGEQTAAPPPPAASQ